MVESSLYFQLLSDPKGELAKRCELWNADESVAVPAIVVVDREGVVRYLYAGRDFADRPGDEKVLAALEEMPEAGEIGSGVEPEVRFAADEAESSTVRPERPAISLEHLVPYYRGVFFTTVALKRRFGELRDRDAFKEVDRYQRMVKEYRARLTRPAKISRARNLSRVSTLTRSFGQRSSLYVQAIESVSADLEYRRRVRDGRLRSTGSSARIRLASEQRSPVP
jgi:hypothetical protein